VVFIRLLFEFRWDEFMARNTRHRLQNSLIADSTTTELRVNHVVARLGVAYGL
jgi:hypothetical protein